MGKKPFHTYFFELQLESLPLICFSLMPVLKVLVSIADFLHGFLESPPPHFPVIQTAVKSFYSYLFDIECIYIFIIVQHILV